MLFLKSLIISFYVSLGSYELLIYEIMQKITGRCLQFYIITAIWHKIVESQDLKYFRKIRNLFYSTLMVQTLSLLC